MNLERYNRIALAVVSTAVLLTILGLGTVVVSALWEERELHGIAARNADVTGAKRNLTLCLPVRVPGSDYEFLPVASVAMRGAGGRATVTSSSSRSAYNDFGDQCDVGYGRARVFNVVVRNTRTNEERLLLHESAQLVGVTTPESKCKDKPQVPDGVLLWTIRSTDSDKDGVIDDSDATVAYLSDLSARNLVQVTPTEATMLSSAWSEERRTLLFEIRRDLNGDHAFTAEDGSDVIEVDVNHPAVGVPALKPETVQALTKAIE